MTEKQAEAEIRYRLAKFLLFRLQEENLLTPDESEKVQQALCKKYKPDLNPAHDRHNMLSVIYLCR